MHFILNFTTAESIAFDVFLMIAEGIGIYSLMYQSELFFNMIKGNFVFLLVITVKHS